MRNRHYRFRTFVRAAALAAVFALAPIAFSQNGGIKVNEAECSGAGCCKNADGICDTSGGVIRGYENKSKIQQLLGC